MLRKYSLLFLLLFGALAFAQTQKPAKKMGGEHMNKTKEVKAMTAGDLKWGEAPPGLPPGAQLAVLEGNPMAPGIFVIRLKASDGYKVPPHWHPTAENVTVVSGQLQLGMGKTEDEASAQTLNATDFISMPARHPHYAIAKGETVIQIEGKGPFQITYVNPKDDPRKTQASAAKKPSKKKM